MDHHIQKPLDDYTHTSHWERLPQGLYGLELRAIGVAVERGQGFGDPPVEAFFGWGYQNVEDRHGMGWE